MTARLLTQLAARATPAITAYVDDATPPERVECSGRVLMNWVSKAANLMQDEFDAGPGRTVTLDLPAHWRTTYWALATWAVGATVITTDPADVDILITSRADSAYAVDADDIVLVSLPALTRSHPQATKLPGAIDEARELVTYGDQFSAHRFAAETDIAWRNGPTETSYADLLIAPHLQRRALVDPTVADVISHLSTTVLAGGSLVLITGASGDQSARLASEGAVIDATAR